MSVKKLDYTKENLRLLASIIADATSGSLFTKLLIDAGWLLDISYQEAGKNKEDFLYDEFKKIGESGREDILEYVIGKTISKSTVYFKSGIKGYKFPRDQFAEFKKKLKIDKILKPKINEKLFRDRKFHKSVVFVSKGLFIDGHYSQSIFESCKALEIAVKRKTKLTLSGVSLMQSAFSPNKPVLKLNGMADQSEKDEQAGFMHLYSGTMQGIRDPKGHSNINLKDREKALEYLSLLSLLFRRLDEVQVSQT